MNPWMGQRVGLTAIAMMKRKESVIRINEKKLQLATFPTTVG